MGRVSDARQRLIDAAISLIARDGYSAVSVDALCDTANVKKGSFYHFFPSKDDLVVIALAEHWASRRPGLNELFASDVSPIERFERYFRFIGTRQQELLQTHGRVIGCMFLSVGNECAGIPRIAEQVQEIATTYVAFYAQALAEAKASGELNIDQVEPRARALFALVEGTLAQARIHNDLSQLADLYECGMGLVGANNGPPRRKAS